MSNAGNHVLEARTPEHHNDRYDQHAHCGEDGEARRVGAAEVVRDERGAPVPNAVIVAVPDVHLRGRVDHFRKTVSDQSGQFVLRGIPPGDYSLRAWESVDGEAYYNPEFLRNYEGQGTALHVREGERKNLQLEVIPDPEEQP